MDNNINLAKEVTFTVGPVQLGRMVVKDFDLSGIGGMICIMLSSGRGEEIFETIKEEMEYHEGLYK